MGTSGLFLKKVELFNTQNTLKEIKSILDSLGFNYSAGSISSESNGFHLGINDPACNADFCMYIFDAPKPEYMEDDDFSWISSNLYAAILIEDLCDSEDSTLKILHEYLKIHPDEYFYAEEDWYYDKNAIDNIFESGKWHHWCYKNPKDIPES